MALTAVVMAAMVQKSDDIAQMDDAENPPMPADINKVNFYSLASICLSLFCFMVALTIFIALRIAYDIKINAKQMVLHLAMLLFLFGSTLADFKAQAVQVQLFWPYEASNSTILPKRFFGFPKQ